MNDRIATAAFQRTRSLRTSREADRQPDRFSFSPTSIPVQSKYSADIETPIGYARVSTDDQDLTNQRAELHAAGCARIFAEKITGTRRERPELARMLDHLRGGDVVTVTRLDRLARSTRDLLEIAERLRAAGAGLRSLDEPWADTTTPAGRMVLTVFAGIAEFERSLIIDRTRTEQP